MRKPRLLTTSMALVERYAQLQRERNENLILAHAYYNGKCEEEQAQIIAEVADQLLAVIVRVLKRVSWIEPYFDSLENLHNLGVMDEIMATAITGMHLYPNRYNLLVDYIPDATIAVVLCDIGDSLVNQFARDWDMNFEPGVHGFSQYILRDEISDDPPWLIKTQLREAAG